MAELHEILALVRKTKLPTHDEKATQLKFAEALTNAGIEFQREVRLSDEDIVDFMVGDIAIEMKLKGNSMKIYRQLERYSKNEKVGQILLLTAKSMGLPPFINSKASVQYSLSKSWLF